MGRYNVRRMEVIAALPAHESEGTNVRRFLAQRGVLVIRESRDIGRLKGQYSDSINIASVLFSIIKGTTQDATFGVQLERIDSDGNTESSAFLDFDELAELIEAFDFISSVAPKMAREQRDYTEVSYSTKDNVKFGFYQKDGQQLAFVNVQAHGDSTFLPVEKLQQMKQSLVNAQTHLISRGAAVE